MEGSGAQETLMPATTIDPTASSFYTVSISTTVSSTADTAGSGSIFNNQPIVVASFVLELADIAVDLLILLLLVVVICLLLRLLHVYRRHTPPSEKLNEERIVNIYQEPVVETPVAQTSDVATQTDAQILSPGPVSPLIGELGAALQRRTRTIKQKSETTIDTQWLPDLKEERSEPGTQSTNKQEQAQAVTPSLSCRSPVKQTSPVKLLTADKQSSKAESKEQTPVEESEEPDIKPKPLLKTSASAPMLNLKKLKITSKPAASSETLKIPKKKKFTLKKTKDKRYKQKEMENEVAEPVRLEEEDPELVMLVRMVRLEGNEEDDEKTTDL